MDPLPLAQTLLAQPSITPARGAVFDVLEAALVPLGFAVDRFVAGEGDDAVENLLATRGEAGPHLAFAGHLDVVPPGEGWQAAPFGGELRGDLLYGRGAVDMKGAVAAFVAAAARVTGGRQTLIITGDEEGVATHGTVKLIERMAARGIRPDLCIVGEPTSVARLGDTIKIGRRGSLYIWFTVTGTQGHVAYPHLADNPIPRLIAALAEIDALVLDRGTDWFQPSSLAITDVTVGNRTSNVIPGAASARLGIRFNDLHRGIDLVARIAAIVERHAPGTVVESRVSGEAFLTAPGDLSDLVSGAIETHTGLVPELSTSGGTSDARFLSRLCPTVEFGLLNATMHKLDEAVSVTDLRALADIYATVLERVVAG